jgi:DivIVA domain-containing protein
MDDEATAQATIARIRDARFRTTPWAGYDITEVDAFLDQLIARLDHSGSIRQGSGPTFTRTRLRPGYRKGEVDAFLRGLGAYRT